MHKKYQNTKKILEKYGRENRNPRRIGAWWSTRTAASLEVHALWDALVLRDFGRVGARLAAASARA